MKHYRHQAARSDADYRIEIISTDAEGFAKAKEYTKNTGGATVDDRDSEK